jgi:hypothetical protein
MPTTMKLFHALVTAIILFLLGAQLAIAQDKLPPEVQGDWVLATATCDSPVRFRAEESQMTLINGKDSESYDDIGVTYSYFGPEYQGPSFVSIPHFNSDQPFTVFFNADDQKDVTKLDIYQKIEGTTNPKVIALQAAAKKLAERFPLNLVPLKKCPSAGAAS